MSAVLSNIDEVSRLKVPPHSIEAEQSVLGGLMLKHEKAIDVRSLVSVEEFYRQDHRLIFEAQLAVYDMDDQIDIITVNQWLLDNGRSADEFGGLAYLGTLAKDTPSSANIEGYARIVREKYQLRRLISIGSELVDDAFHGDAENINDLVQSAGKSLDTVLENQVGESFDISGIQDVTFKFIDECVESRKTKGVTGVPLGLPELDKRLGGLQKKKFYLIAARPGSGKTAIANQFAIHASTNGFKIGILSLEMGTEELGLRFLAHFYKVSGTALMLGNEHERTNLKQKISSYKSSGKKLLEDADIQLDTETYSLSGITSVMTQWKRKHGLDAVFVDHLGLVEHKGNNRNESVGDVSRQMKKLSKRLDIAVVGLVQLNRENVKLGRRPQESDLRDSGSLEQDADVIMFLHADENSKGEDIRLLDIGLSKVRYGIPGWIPQKQGGAPFGFEGKTQTIREIGNAVYE